MSNFSAHQIRQASSGDIDLVAPLFDAYRQFYGGSADLALARGFLLERLRQEQSVIFMALAPDGTTPLGFTQLYPAFSSLSAARIFILNDLYVAPQARRLGVGAGLLQAAVAYARAAGAVRLTLSTAIDNHTAQSLYVAQGWRRDDAFAVFNFSLAGDQEA